MPLPDADWAPPAWLAACAAVALAWLAARYVARLGPLPAAPEPGWRVTLEVVLLSAGADGALSYRVLRTSLPGGADPDAAALAASGLDEVVPPPGAVSHATSWRAVPGGEVVLTYTVVPDPSPAGQAVPLTAPSIICSDHPLKPSPRGLHDHHVAAHGARHLAYLAVTDPAVRRCANAAPDVWRAISTTASAPVAPHQQAHALAEDRVLRWVDNP